MKNKKIIVTLAVSCILLIPDSLSQTLNYTSTDDAHVVIKGTATMHSWKLSSETMMSEVIFNTGNGETIESLESVMFTLEKTTLESDRSRMARDAHEEMDADNHPRISFRSNGNGNIERNGDEYRVTATGDLTISGITRQVSVEATCIKTGDEMVCTGTRDLKMTDYDIDPPTVMLGAIRTHDDVTVEFRIVYSQ